MKTKIVNGSLSDMAQKTNQSLPAIMAEIEAVVIVDVSGSMSSRCKNSTRYDIANEKLAELQEKYQGKIALIQFSDYAELVPSGYLSLIGHGTDMYKALYAAKDYDDLDLKIILVSDGEPNEYDRTLDIAKIFITPIDTIFIGDERDRHGRDFLRQLSNVSGGKAIQKVGAELLSESIETLLLTG